MSTKTLKGKTVVITGASSGAGRAAAEAFALEECNVVLAARGKEGLEETLSLCRDLEVVALAVPTDVSVWEEVENLAQQALQFNGRIDIWINNAGVMATGKFDDMPPQIIQQIINTNLTGYLFGARAVLPIFKNQGDGILINNVSVGGWMPVPYGTAYSASKFGLRGMVEALQGEVSEFPDIHISALYPGMLRSTGNMHSAKYSGFNAKIPPMALDPRELADMMVKVAKRPKKENYPDWTAFAMKYAYGLFPKTVINTGSAAMRMMMKFGNQSETNGNILVPSSEPHRIYGETMLPVPSRKTKKLMFAATLGAAAYVLFKNSGDKKLKNIH